LEIIYKNFDKNHIPDNEAQYFLVLSSIIENIDKYCYFVITKNPDSYMFRISTSLRIVDPLIKQINAFNTASHIEAIYSKSIKSGNIFFKIPI
jgi:hypothetical protein